MLPDIITWIGSWLVIFFAVLLMVRAAIDDRLRRLEARVTKLEEEKEDR